MGTCCCVEESRPKFDQLKPGPARRLEREETPDTVPQSKEGKKPASQNRRDSSVKQIRPKRLGKKHHLVGVKKGVQGCEIPEGIEIHREKTDGDRNQILSALQKLFIVSSLAEEQIEQLTNAMKLFSLKANQIVFQEGEPALHFFILCNGKLDIILNGRILESVNPGHGFGELALLHDTVRTATVRCKFDSMVWGLDRNTFKQFVESINAQQHEENKAFLETVQVFEILTRKQKEKLLQVLTTSKFAAGTKIISEGEKGEVLFFIKEGTVSCRKNNKEIRKLGEGEFFGEQALLYGGFRTATVVAQTPVKCISIGAAELTASLGSSLQQIIYRNSIRMAFERRNLVKFVSADELETLISAVRVSNHVSKEVVIPKGTPKDSALWIILKGELATGRRLEVKIGMFEIVGDLGFDSKEMHEFNLTVNSETADIGRIGKEEFEKCIGGSLLNAKQLNEARNVISGMTLFRTLSKENLKKLTSALSLSVYNDCDIIVRQHEQGDSFYIIQSGLVQVVKEGTPLRQISKEDYFGERSILFNELRSATIIALGEVRCWVLHQNDFNRLIDERVRKQLIRRIQMQDDAIKLQELIAVKPLGKGNFGVVVLAVNPKTRRLYAIKAVSREKTEQYHLKDSLMMERNTLRQLDHNFIMKLIKTSKDATHFHFLMEYVRGSDFFTVLREIDNVLTPPQARFYLCALILVVEHLHERDIIHRDIKPENIMIDEEGYPKLIDFGTAIIVKGRTYTIIGTPHYMAPEVITGKGYDVMADYWSLGVILYECLCGAVPFGEEEEDPYRIYELVLKGKLTYPLWISKSTITNSKPIIEKLLLRNPAMRLGGSLEKFKQEAWFDGLDWVNST